MNSAKGAEMSEQRSSADSAEPIYQCMDTGDDEGAGKDVWLDVTQQAYAEMQKRTGIRSRVVYALPQSVPMPENVEVAIKRMKTLADTALPGRAYEEECQAQLRNACVLLEMAYLSQEDSSPQSVGCICQEQHRRGHCTEPGCPFARSQAESMKPHEAPEWLWYGEVGGKPIVTFGRWPKHGARWRYKLAEIQPTEHDNRSQATTRPQCEGK